MDKIYATAAEAIADVEDGATIMFGGFGCAGTPTNLILALYEKGTKNITAISNNMGLGDRLDVLCEKKQLKKFIASFPVRATAQRISLLEEQYLAGEVEIETIPQGTLVERMRAAGAGIGGFYTPTGVGTVVEQGKEKRVIDGVEHLLEYPLRADFAFVKALKADTMGNLVYRMSGRNFNPIMAMAADVTIVDVEEIVEVGELDPEVIVTPSVFVSRIVKGPRHDIRWFD
jgi:3-oxoacid CoA-transferase subunit A